MPLIPTNEILSPVAKVRHFPREMHDQPARITADPCNCVRHAACSINNDNPNH
jgi:hypothetical protein